MSGRLREHERGYSRHHLRPAARVRVLVRSGHELLLKVTSLSPSAGRASPVTMSKSDRTAEAFKEAARRVFARQGYTATKITDITAEAGRATGGIYRYFASKAAVLQALADDFLQARHNRVVHASGDSHTMVTEQDVREHVQAYWQSYREYLPEMVAIYQAAVSDPQFAEVQQEIRAKDLAIWRTHIKQLRAHIGKPVSDAGALATMVVSLLENYCYTTQHLGKGGTRKNVDTLAGFVYGGITN
jgi:AcrR family transcriptional regulator